MIRFTFYDSDVRCLTQCVITLACMMMLSVIMPQIKRIRQLASARAAIDLDKSL
jgi:hypothetical protein